MALDILKVRHMRSSGGADREFWEDHWEGRDLGHAVRRLATDPVAAALDAHLPSGSRLLEGGCGQGEYVVYERARGVWTVGLDFALDPLLALRALAPELPLVVGDVHALPFRDGSLPAYYSGGVVEHFEGGPEPALAEAHRVLAPDGILLVSVPYLSPLRRMLRWFRRDRWFAVSTTRAEVPREPGPFFQYVFSPRQFDQSLAAAHLRVSTHFGYGIIRGAVELGAPLEKWLRRGARRRSSGPEGPRVDPDVPVDAAHVSLVRRLLVAEDASVPGFGWLVRWLRWGCANMQMYVCRPR